MKIKRFQLHIVDVATMKTYCGDQLRNSFPDCTAVCIHHPASGEKEKKYFVSAPLPADGIFALEHCATCAENSKKDDANKSGPAALIEALQNILGIKPGEKCPGCGKVHEYVH